MCSRNTNTNLLVTPTKPKPGMSDLLEANLILVLAWALGDVLTDLSTAPFLAAGKISNCINYYVSALYQVSDI